MLQPNVQHYIVPHCNRLNWSFTQFTLITLSLKPSPCQSRCCTVWFQFEFDFQIWIKFVELHYNCIALLHLYSPAIRVSWILKEILTLNKTCWIVTPYTVFCTVLKKLYSTLYWNPFSCNQGVCLLELNFELNLTLNTNSDLRRPALHCTLHCIEPILLQSGREFWIEFDFEHKILNCYALHCTVHCIETHSPAIRVCACLAGVAGETPRGSKPWPLPRF